MVQFYEAQLPSPPLPPAPATAVTTRPPSQRTFYAPSLTLYHLASVCSTHDSHSRNEGANTNTNTLFEYCPTQRGTLFEYCPTQRGDPNHYWLVGDGTAGSSYYRGMTTLYADSGSLSTRYGGIAIY